MVDLLDFYFKNYKDIRLCTSFLNLIEIPNTLIESGIRNKMYLDGTPFQYYDEFRRRIIKNKNYQDEIKKTIDNYYRFFKKNKIWFIKKLGLFKEKDFREIDRLTIYFNIPIQDAIIFFLAKKEGGYFVTRDNKHFLENKELKKEYHKIIKIVSPNAAQFILKKEIRELHKKKKE